ncbi:hypothetical protein [Tritonibacter scottomollicae]|uniref:Uncharacterized protein n=1 Tax=Tritonibacter scottomollicae TaxID=483013 RepID=A0A2T1AGZ7_TRISK|nr:hypothetical protein [Tritonibacter scottomollicae]PRZ47875.1 hypothetical protein CLV89_10596 [Tritonibacter scottomollicae]
MSWTGWILVSLAVVASAILAEAKWRSKRPRRLADSQPVSRSKGSPDLPLGMEATNLEAVKHVHRANQKADTYNRSISRTLSR